HWHPARPAGGDGVHRLLQLAHLAAARGGLAVLVHRRQVRAQPRLAFLDALEAIGWYARRAAARFLVDDEELAGVDVRADFAAGHLLVVHGGDDDGRAGAGRLGRLLGL